MSRIKVTAYIDPDEVVESGDIHLLDLSHEMGVSNVAFERPELLVGYATDFEFELVEDD
jgi:hypothetical protein